MIMMIIPILLVLELCGAYSQAVNPPMITHASMDVGNIISIVIPESPDENINVEQLTTEFRQQLERIKKQSRANKVEYGPVTLKRVLPEMSREEKRKTLPLIRRVLHGRRVGNSGSMTNWTREASRTKQMPVEVERLDVASHSGGNSEEGKIYRDYEEIGNRERVAMRFDKSIADGDNHRRNGETHYGADRRTPEELREYPIDQNRQMRPEEFIQHEESTRRENRYAFPELERSSSKISESGYRREPWNRNKNDFHRNEGYDKLATVPEFRARISEEPIVDCTKLDRRTITKDSTFGQDGAEASNPNWDGIKLNGSEQLTREAVTLDRRGYQASQMFIHQEPRRGEQFESSSKSGFKNIDIKNVNDNATEKNKDRNRYVDFHAHLLANSNPPSNGINGWSVASYDDRRAANSSEDKKEGASSVYEIFGEKDIAPNLAYIQREPSDFHTIVKS